MSSRLTKDDQDSVSYEVLLNENCALQDEMESLREEIKSLRTRLAEAEELKRAISEGDLDALVIYRPEGELIFTLDSADRAYRTLVETMNEGTVTVACDSTILYCNRQFAELIRMSPESIVGRSIYQFIEPESEVIFRGLLNQGNKREEISLQAGEGQIIPVYLSISSLQAEEFPKAWCLVITDLTERKKDEEIIANIENARRKEIHHRIKNNLQVISSLLDLQAEKFKNRKYIRAPEFLEAFRESQDRVMSIALIHEELHEGEGADTLNFSLYLEKLIEDLFQTYRVRNANINLNLDLAENIFFDMDTAVPLGMVVNELVSNSLKYAFPDRNKGEIQINLHKGNKKDENTEYVLNVSDNGIGIHQNINFENPDTLGLQLVNILVDQIDGCIKLKRDNGTEFTIWFNDMEKRVN